MDVSPSFVAAQPLRHPSLVGALVGPHDLRHCACDRCALAAPEAAGKENARTEMQASVHVT